MPRLVGSEYKEGRKRGLDGTDVWRNCPYRKEDRSRLFYQGVIDGLAERLRAAELRHITPSARRALHRTARDFPGAIRIPLANEPAIYFLLKAGKVLYVGQSQNVIGRIAAHLQRQIYDEIIYLPTALESLNSEERRWIRIFNPPLNRTRGIHSDRCPYAIKIRS